LLSFKYLLCKKFIWGLVNQAYQCKICNYVSHKKCLATANSISDCNTRFLDEDNSHLEKMSLKDKQGI